EGVDTIARHVLLPRTLAERPEEPQAPLGFREKQRQRKAAREVARAETEAKQAAKAPKAPKSRKK
ncbi:hypothetical protein ACLESO_56375, partial [Pyxidicoccus sp. 3LG]